MRTTLLLSSVLLLASQLPAADVPKDEALRSVESDAAVHVEFVNRLDEPVTIAWIDYQGKERKIGSVPSGETLGQRTWTTHPFVAQGEKSDFRKVLYPPAIGGEVPITRHRILNIKGWSVHVNESLYTQQPEKLKTMMELLEVQLQRVIDAVPAEVLPQLRRVALWANPTYPNRGPSAEYHPELNWLQENGRDPAMAKGIEITNVQIFERENRRMPYVLLHELAHAYHDQVLGFDHPEVIAAFDQAKRNGGYDQVKRFNGNSYSQDKAYAMTNHKEYFAETSEAYFGKNDFFPFDRKELKSHDPRMYAVLKKVWNIPNPDDWVIDTAEQWEQAIQQSEGLKLSEGLATPTQEKAQLKSKLKKFQQKRQAKSITFTQSAAWDNWTPVPSVGPQGTRNAPVFLPVAPGDYWYFAEKQGGPRGYHAWHSTDMKNWTHHGRVTKSRWMTTAEYADGKFYLYYDEPNDEDPHLVIAEDIKAGKLQDLGKVLADPSHGSDAGVIRTGDGVFHLFYEDWRPINARKHSWDSPLAGHADSPDGIHGFEPGEHPAPIDKRTQPTGKFATYPHPASKKPYPYEIHEGPQDAFGDYTAIGVGKRFYLFCDYDPHDAPMRVGYWSSDSITAPFQWGGDIGSGFHPDPTIGFAEGKFYLIVQRAKQDYVSPGPWVESVEARVGVDTNGDGQIDQWTDWRVVQEKYQQKKGFARLVETTPAAINLSELPAGLGFRFEVRLEDRTENKSKPILDQVHFAFEEVEKN